MVKWFGLIPFFWLDVLWDWMNLERFVINESLSIASSLITPTLL